MAGGSGLRPGAARRLRLGRLALRGAATATSIAGKTRQNALPTTSRRTLSRGPPTAPPAQQPPTPPPRRAAPRAPGVRQGVEEEPGQCGSLGRSAAAVEAAGHQTGRKPAVGNGNAWLHMRPNQHSGGSEAAPDAFSFGVGRSVGRRGGGPHPTPSPRLELCLAAATWQRRRYRWCHHTLPPPRLRVDRHGGANETGTPTCEQPLRSRHPHPRRQSIRSPQGRRHYRRQHLGGCKSGRSSGLRSRDAPHGRSSRIGGRGGVRDYAHGRRCHATARTVRARALVSATDSANYTVRSTALQARRVVTAVAVRLRGSFAMKK